MLSFLRQTRKLVNAKESVCIVIGNESCDLDSAVCAVSLAYFYQNNKSSFNATRSYNYLPVLNISEQDYPLKTEVKYIFETININNDLLTFKDELNQQFLNNNRFVLVDHHVSPWSKNCIAIYDHRPKDEAANIPDTCQLNLNLVGSCATLIAEKFLSANLVGVPEKDILNLLRSTIVLDTVNFCKSAGRATAKDVEICLALEKALSKLDCLISRDEIFESLVKARADVSSLTAYQLLRKDFKILTSSKNENIKIALPGFPLPVKQFILKSNAQEAVTKFATEYNCSVVLLMGMYIRPEDKSVERDFGLINISDSCLCKSIEERLLSLDEPQLSIEYCKDCNFMDGSFYKLLNIKVTRKHILPLLKIIIDK